MDWTQNPTKNAIHKTTKPKESPTQKIKRLEKELKDERLKNLFFDEVINILDAEHGTSLRKKYISKEQEAFKAERGQPRSSLQAMRDIEIERLSKRKTGS